MNLKDIFVNIKAKFDDKDVKKGKSSVDGLTKAMTGLAAAYTIKKGVSWVNNLSDQIDKLEKQSRAVKMSTSDLSAFKFAAGLSGVEGNSFVRVLGMVQKKAADMSQGLEQATKNFKMAGLGMQDITDAGGHMLGVEEIFLRVADGISKLEATKQTGAAMKIFGEQGQALVPMLSEGREAIEANMKEAKKMGFVYGKEAADAAVKLRDANTRLEGSMISLKNVIAVPLMKAVADITLKFSAFVTEIRDIFAGVDLTYVGMMALAAIAIPAVLAGLNLLMAHPWVMAIAAGIVIVDDLRVAFEGGQSAIREFFLEFFQWDILPTLDGIASGFLGVAEAIGRTVTMFKGLYEIQAAIFKLKDRGLAAIGLGDAVDGSFSDDIAKGFSSVGAATSSKGDYFGAALVDKLAKKVRDTQSNRDEALARNMSVPVGVDPKSVDYDSLRFARAEASRVRRDEGSTNEQIRESEDAARRLASGGAGFSGGGVTFNYINPTPAQVNATQREAMSRDNATNYSE